MPDRPLPHPTAAASASSAGAPPSAAHSLDLASFLPDRWDVHTDLAVLVGSGHWATAVALLEHGQQRVILHLSGGECAQELPDPARITRTRPELLQAVLNYPEPLSRNVIVRRASGTEVSDEELRSLGKDILECLRSKELLHHTVEQQSGPNALRALANVDDIARLPSVACLEGAFARKPCVIVSPGPSLSKNLHLLKQLKGHALIMTGTHALSVFDRIGLAPDFVLAADSGDLDRHYGTFDERTIEALFLSVACRRDQFERRAPRRFTFAGNPECEAWLFDPFGEDAGVSTGGSVACSALALAVRLGCDPIVFVGQDLSFEGGRYYAKECLDGDAEVVESEAGFQLHKPGADDSLEGMTQLENGQKIFADRRERIEVPGYHGGVVASSRPFLAFKFWFETFIESMNGKQRVWNCTEGGAHIRGARQLPLSEALPRLAAGDLNVGSILDDRTAALASDERRATLREHFEAMSLHLDRCLVAAQNCLGAAERALENPSTVEDLAREEARLKEALGPLRLLSVVAQRDIAMAVDSARRATDLQGNVEASMRLFRIIEDKAQSLGDPIRAALARLSG